MDEFMIRALIGGGLVALAAGPVGCFILWRRMAYLGASLAHMGLLGVALGLLLGINPILGVAATSAVVALLLAGLERVPLFAADTMIGLVGHAGLALGLVALAFMDRYRADLMGYLFGDVLAIQWGDLLWIALGCLAALACLAAIWRPLLSLTVNEEIATVEGVNAGRIRLVFLLLVAAVIAAGMTTVGVLLIVTLLIIPAAAARLFTAGPEAMAIAAALIGLGATVAGLFASLELDTPAGPSIALAAALLFAGGLVLRALHEAGSRRAVRP